jgi:hypothetical protein
MAALDKQIVACAELRQNSGEKQQKTLSSFNAQIMFIGTQLTHANSVKKFANNERNLLHGDSSFVTTALASRDAQY